MKRKNGYKMALKMLDGLYGIFEKICEATSDEDITLQCDKIGIAINRLQGIIRRKMRIKEK